MEFTPLSFSAGGWGPDMVRALGVTILLSMSGMALGCLIGILGSACQLSGRWVPDRLSRGYVALMRGVPDLLVIYLFYFGSSQVLTALGQLMGADGFVGVPLFLIGAAALGVVSGAYLTEVFRGAVQAVPRGEVEAAVAYGMTAAARLRRVTLPLAVRHALPGLGNVWQLVLKESALISVIGLVELMRQAQIGAGSTRKAFSFFLAAGALYLLVAWASGRGFRIAERRALRGMARGGLGGEQAT